MLAASLVYTSLKTLKGNKFGISVVCLTISLLIFLNLPINLQADRMIKGDRLGVGGVFVIEPEKSHYPWLQKLRRNISYDLVFSKEPFIDIYLLGSYLKWNPKDEIYHCTIRLLLKNVGLEIAEIENIEWNIFSHKTGKQFSDPVSSLEHELTTEIDESDSNIATEYKKWIKNNKQETSPLQFFTKRTAKIKSLIKERARYFKLEEKGLSQEELKLKISKLENLNNFVTLVELLQREVEGKGKQLSSGEEKLFSYSPQMISGITAKDRIEITIRVVYSSPHTKRKFETIYNGCIDYDTGKNFINKEYNFQCKKFKYNKGY